jgi:CheY-like chemotaxis protein
MMPKKDGFTLAKDIRKIDKEIPIIFLTAKSMTEDKVEGFNSGGDDYLTKPFSFEGEKRRKNAEWAVAQLGRQVDTLITIPNDRLLQTIDRRTPLLETFKIADDVLRQGVQSISDLVNATGLVNSDFADVTEIMKDAGYAHMGVGRAKGKDKAEVAAKQAMKAVRAAKLAKQICLTTPYNVKR